MKRILKNAIENIVTTIAGSVAGITEIRQGIAEQDTTQIIIGVGLLILGIFSKEK